jgi:basic amino acid/polyamine antiporter, APA family
MTSVPAVTKATVEHKGKLLRILGVSFGIAVTLGSTIGMGILRTPGTVAAQLGDVRLILGIWVLGGVYALCGTIAVTELATALPQAGGWYVYARRAFGEYVGFTVGWCNWLAFCSVTASITIVLGEYVGKLVPALAGSTKAIAITALLVFTLLHWLGLRVGSRAQTLPARLARV